VNWTDGPTTGQVQAITSRFQGEGFDGMTDCSYNIPTQLSDGRESGLRLILEERRLSPAFARTIAAQIAEMYGVAAPVITEYAAGGFQIQSDHVFVADTREYWSTLIHRASQDQVGA